MMTADIAQRQKDASLHRARSGDRPAAGLLPAFRRGACPTLSAPMQTGDGLLVRLRPSSGVFTPSAFVRLLDAADRFGNGRLDITARGNLQVRGLTTASVDGLAQAVRAADIAIVEGISVEVPPLAGLDPTEVADPRPLAQALARRIAASGFVLAPKLAVVVDGGGSLHLGHLPADLRMVGESHAGEIVWNLFVGENVAVFASGTAQDVEEAAMVVLADIAALGPAARARDLVWEASDVPKSSSLQRPAARVQRPAARVPVGRIDLGRQLVLGVAPAFGQMEAQSARQLVSAALDHGLDQLRLAPGRSLLLLGLDVAALPALEALAVRLGFVTEAAETVLHIEACTGARGCASGGFDTHALARHLTKGAAPLMDGSVDVHVSGCPKGCARPRSAAITLVAVPAAADARLGLVLAGRSSDEPVATTGIESAASAVTALGDLVCAAKQSGESAASCLKRLGPARIAASFQRD